MPDRDVDTIRDLIYYQYAKIIAKSAFAAFDGINDFILPLSEKKYLKTIYSCHNCSGTLDKGDMDRDNVVTVLDIDAVIR